MNKKQQMMSEMQRQRADINVPLQGFGNTLSKYREKLELPDQFLRAGTLREGTWVIVVILNTVALTLIGFMLTGLTYCWQEVDDWWYTRVRDDFDYYFMKENQDMIRDLWPLWVPITQAVVVANIVYVITGFIVIYALVKRTCHPCWYLPWLIMTGFLLAVMWFTTGTMIICVFILLTYRPLTVTWDIVPIAIIIAYSYVWTYCWFVVIAHYKRRQIVKYWRDRGMVMGTNVFGEQESQPTLPGY